MVGLRQSTAFHRDVDSSGRPLTVAEREKLLKPYLPSAPSGSSTPSPARSPLRQSPSSKRKRSRSSSLRQLIAKALYLLIFNAIHLVFSVYIRFRRAYNGVRGRIASVLYYHHRTPELIRRDVRGLKKVPKHLSVVLEAEDVGRSRGRGRRRGRGMEVEGVEAIEKLVNEVCEIAAWSACVGVQTLSVYERTGILKSSLPHLHHRISATISSYFGPSASRPTISLRAPHQSSYSPPPSPNPTPAATTPHLTVLLLSTSDGRETLVDLTKTLAEMSQKGKLAPEDVSGELIDAEISESVMGEPDLVLLFGDGVILRGYPPWQIRLSEIFHVQDNTGVGYQVFLQGLYKYADAQMRFGS